MFRVNVGLLSCVELILNCVVLFLYFFFNDTATTEIYTLSLHDALPISGAFFVNSGTTQHDDRIDLMQGRVNNQKPRRAPRNQHPNAKDQRNRDKPSMENCFEQTANGSAVRCEAGLCPAV